MEKNDRKKMYLNRNATRADIVDGLNATVLRILWRFGFQRCQGSILLGLYRKKSFLAVDICP